MPKAISEFAPSCALAIHNVVMDSNAVLMDVVEPTAWRPTIASEVVLLLLSIALPAPVLYWLIALAFAIAMRNVILAAAASMVVAEAIAAKRVICNAMAIINHNLFAEVIKCSESAFQ